MKLKPLTLKPFFGMAAAVVLLDQLTKFWVAYAFGEPDTGHAFIILPRCFQIIYRVNTGAAFSVFTEYPGALTLFSTCVATGLLIWSLRLKDFERVLRWPLGLILGGAVGNLIDRYRIGHVVDFVDWHWDDRYHFPTFNVADSAILILISLFTPTRE